MKRTGFIKLMLMTGLSAAFTGQNSAKASLVSPLFRKDTARVANSPSMKDSTMHPARHSITCYHLNAYSLHSFMINHKCDMPVWDIVRSVTFIRGGFGHSGVSAAS